MEEYNLKLPPPHGSSDSARERFSKQGFGIAIKTLKLCVEYWDILYHLLHLTLFSYELPKPDTNHHLIPTKNGRHSKEDIPW